MLEIHKLCVAYGRNCVIADLSASGLQAGSVIALLGPNGSGKSTLLKALAGMTAAASGEVLLNGDNILQASFAERARQIVYLPQSLPTAVHLRVFESILVAANASHYGFGPIENISVSAVESLLKRLGIAHLASCYLDQLSGGQKQLVGLAQALIRKPRLLLLDEPLSALDLNYQFHVMDLLAQETTENGLITVIVLHDLNIALRHAKHALMIRQGALIAAGDPAKVITTEALAEVYGVSGRVERCSQGIFQVLIDGLRSPIQ